MKKYFFGLSAIICAIAFSAFTKPYTLKDFKLLTDPVMANIVNDPNQWSDGADPNYSRCDDAPEDVACLISLSPPKMSSFYHIDANGDLILNDFTYANSQNPKRNYVGIIETIGSSPKRKILSIAFFEWDPTANNNQGAYIDVTGSMTKSSSGDYNFRNARD